MRSNIIWIGCLWAAVLWSCDRNQGEELCLLSSITTVEGDTVSTLEYEVGRLVRINERSPVSVRRFQYDDSLLVREEYFGLSSTLLRYRSYFYESSRLVQMIEYRLNISGEWLPAYREEYSDFSGNLPGVIRSYTIAETGETLSSYCDLLWKDAVLIRLRRWEKIPSSPERLRIAEVQTFTYDSRPSPWPDIPAIEVWKRVRNPLSIESKLIEYLPQGNTVENSSRETFEYRYDRANKVVETLITSPDDMDVVQEFRYSCELTAP